ncbi:MAG: lipid-A-disaccharide synthase [Candidatus Kapaibacterium sp.]|nr:lipid-A-disaccharide synthase [Bacteroidota bacterium]
MRVFIVAGEPSGDLHGARLMQALLQLAPDTEFYGIGGERMIAAGLHSLVPLEQMSVVGFWEVAKRYSFFKSVLQQAATRMKELGCSVFVPVDYPGFNIRLATHARSMGIPVLWYIAPQLWAWGKNRAKQLAQVVNELFVVFPFEVEFFSRYGIDARFVGHPLLDDEDFAPPMQPLEGRNHAVAFLPGSRAQEVERHMPLFVETAQRVKERFPLVRCMVATSPTLPQEVYCKHVADSSLFEFHGDSRWVMKQCAAGVVKTGTSTLEAALCGMPFTMMYKTSMLSYTIAKNLVNLNHISLVNILARKTIVKELIQKEATPQSMANELERLLNNADYAQEMYNHFVEVREMLGESGASVRTARLILEYSI